MDHILFQIFKIILNELIEKHENIADNTSVQIYSNKTKNSIVFKITIDFKL